MKPIWVCGYGHHFTFDEFGQAWGVPTHCFEEYDDGEPCLDSSTLDPVNGAAERAATEWDTGYGKPEWLR